MIGKITLIGGSIFLFGLASGWTLATHGTEQRAPESKVVLDNSRVVISEISSAPGSRREPYPRPSDQIIVFIDEADYETTDAAGTKTIKHRQPGEIVWHNRGEAAPLLINRGKKAYRNLVIALK